MIRSSPNPISLDELFARNAWFRLKWWSQVTTPGMEPFIDLQLQLQDEIMLEIFEYFVAIQDDGPLILTLLSTSWRRKVLDTPNLWKYVLLDQRSTDWNRKLGLSIILSEEASLHLTVRLPVADWACISTFVRRCRSIFVEVPTSMYTTYANVEICTRGLDIYTEMTLGCTINTYIVDNLDDPMESPNEYAGDWWNLPGRFGSVITRDPQDGCEYRYNSVNHRMALDPLNLLNSDVLHQIIKEYLAFEYAGIFILTRLSRSWRYFVETSPTLWQMAPYDEINSESEARLLQCIRYSQSLLLHLTVQLPIGNWAPVISIISRCHSIRFQIPKHMTIEDSRIGTEGLFKSIQDEMACTFTWYHQKYARRRGSGIEYHPDWWKLRLKFDGLDTDVIIEIFDYVVAQQKDALIELMSVSDHWCELIYRSPILWRWITIDEDDRDWVVKLHLFASMAKQIPLRLTIRLPFSDWSPISMLIARLQAIYFEIPDSMSGQDVHENTKNFFDSIEVPQTCDIQWYRAGAQLPKESRKRLSLHLEHLSTLNLHADGSEHSRYRRYARTRNTQYISAGDQYHPLVLLKYYHTLKILCNAPHLQTLELSHHALDPRSSDIDLPIVTLHLLRNLFISDINTGRNGQILPLLHSLKVPNLSVLSMAGKSIDLWEISSSIRTFGRPSFVYLTIVGTNGATAGSDPSQGIQSNTFRQIRSLSLVIEESTFLKECRRTVEDINRLLRLFQEATDMKINFPPNWSLGNFPTNTSCVHHSGEASISDEAGTKTQCNISHVHLQTQLTQPASDSIKELDISIPGRGRACSSMFYDEFKSLTTLKCTPFVLLPLLSSRTFPSLHTLHFHWPKAHPWWPDYIERELVYCDNQVIEWLIQHCEAFPRLTTMGFSWFPVLQYSKYIQARFE